MTTRSILITGCSSGIGLSTALALKERGYRVFATARKPSDIERLITLGFDACELDVTNDASRKTVMRFVLEKTNGELYALFNNAGFLQAGAIEDLSLDAMRAQFETNVFGAIAMTQLALPIMRQQGYGRIIQNSSILGIITLPYYGAYNASKFALEGFSLSLRQELAGSPIHLSLINPGPIYSDLRENAYQIYQTTLTSTADSHHHHAYTRLEQGYFKNRGHSSLTASPDQVVKKVIHALESKRPHAHYYVGLPAQGMALLKRLLPERALEWVLNKINS